MERTIPAGGAGAPNADYILIVTAQNTQQCGGATLGYAGACVSDDIARPVAGRYNHCPTKIDTDPAEARGQMMVAIHEM